MNRGELVQSVANKTELPVTTVDVVLTATLEVIALTIRTEEDVSIRGFGRFIPRWRVATVKINQRTGERNRIPKRLSMVFLPSPQLKERLNGRRRRRTSAARKQPTRR